MIMILSLSTVVDMPARWSLGNKCEDPKRHRLPVLEHKLGDLLKHHHPRRPGKHPQLRLPGRDEGEHCVWRTAVPGCLGMAAAALCIAKRVTWQL